MVTVKTAIIFLIFLFSLDSRCESKANEFDWNELKLQLPFPTDWALQKPRQNPHDPITFMKPSAPSPRVIGNLSETTFNLAMKDFSDFKAEFLKSKKAWAEKSGGKLTSEPLMSFDSKKTLFKYEFSFTAPQGDYVELGHYQRCKGLKSYSLRVMIPKAQFQSASPTVSKIISFFRQQHACP